MARNGTHSKDIEAYFKANPGKAIRLSTLMKVAKCDKQAVSSAISYLNQKARTGKGGLRIEALTRGQSWAYYPDVHFENPFEINEPPEFTATTTVQDKVNNRVAAEARRAAANSGAREARAKLSKLADKLTAPAPDWAEVEQTFRNTESVVLFVPIGKTEEGHMLVKNDTGNVFRVVPV